MNMMIWKLMDVVTRERVRRDIMKFYTIKLPKFLGGIVRAMLGTFKKG